MSIFFRVLRIDKDRSHGVDVRRDRLDQKRWNKGVFDEGEPLRVPLQVPIGHLYISFGTRSGLNGEQIFAARLAVLRHPKTNAFADLGLLRPDPRAVVDSHLKVPVNEDFRSPLICRYPSDQSHPRIGTVPTGSLRASRDLNNCLASAVLLPPENERDRIVIGCFQWV